MTKKNTSINRRRVKKTLLITSIVIITVITSITVTPYMYEWILGDKVTHKILNNVVNGTDDPLEIALKIHKWEHKEFHSPYADFLNKNFIEKILNRIGFYKHDDGSYGLFRPLGHLPTPPVWTIHSKLANCGEFAKVFVYLLNKMGIEARIVTALGEDHAWTEFFIGGQKIVFDPSLKYNPIIIDTLSWGSQHDFSLVISMSIFDKDVRDISDEYIHRKNLEVTTHLFGKPSKNVKVTILSTTLMEKDPSRYTGPVPVILKKTNDKGVVIFNLGIKSYVISAEKCYWTICFKENTKVNLREENKIDIWLTIDKGKTLFRTSVFLLVVSSMISLLYIRSKSSGKDN